MTGLTQAEIRSRRFEVAVQKSRAVVYSVAWVIGTGGMLAGILDFSWLAGLLFLALANLSALLFGLLGSAGVTRVAGVPTRPMWMAVDVGIITWAIFLSGGSESSWYPWYLTNAATAAYLSGTVGLVAIMILDVVAYVGLVIAIENPDGASILALLVKMAILYGSCAFALLGIVRLQKNRRMISKLRRTESLRTSELEKALGTMATSAEALAREATRLTAVSRRMTSSAETTEHQASTVSGASEDVSANVSTVAGAVEELNASVREISRHAHEAAAVASEGVDAVAGASTMIARFRTSSTQIQSVVATITAIAEQTRMLSLNASIEAARAGDAGAGFAVVADEVKELAHATAAAVDDVRENVDRIIADTDAAVTTISHIQGTIEQIHELQDTIAAAVEQQSTTTAAIAENVADAAKGGREIADGVLAVARTAATAASDAGETMAAAQDLAGMANVLREGADLPGPVEPTGPRTAQS